jgi:hypothetical protein
MSSMKYPYRDLGVPFDRNFRNNLNANFDDIEHDIRMIGGEAAQQALEAAEEANTQAIYAQTSGDYAQDKGDYAAQQGDFAQTQGNFANEKGLYAQQQSDYAKAQGDYAKQVADENKTRWLNPVATFADIATTYPNPQHGDTVMVTDDGENSGSVYRYENGQWNLTQKHNDLAIADVQNKIDGIVSVTDKTKRPRTFLMGYEQSPSKLYPNLMNKLLNGDLTTLKIVGVGDSHMAGQGADELGLKSAPALAAPPGVTDGFHKKVDGSGRFFDQFVRKMASMYGLGITRRIADVEETTYYHVYSGSGWISATDSRMLTASGSNKIRTSKIAGDSVILRLDPSNLQRCVTIHLVRLPSAGIFNVYVRTNNQPGLSGLTRNDFQFKKPSEIPGMVRSDGATGTAMDTIDLYYPTGDYSYTIGFTFPFLANWEIKLEVADSKNPSSSDYICGIGPTVIEHENFINAGRGNHTTLDYLGNTVTKGAGGSGDFDHTDHLAEVLDLNPSLILLEPMIINDWFHGVSLQDSRSTIHEMIRRIKRKGVDILCITPAPVITDYAPFDYSQNPDYTTKPPLTNNLNGLGTYEQYITVIKEVCAMEQVPLINMYDYFIERFYKPDHQNWTIGTNAGRIHVNQHGHNIYFDGIVENSRLF